MKSSRELDPELQIYFDQVNRKFFDGFLELPALRWNSRLRSSAGRFIPGTRAKRNSFLLGLLGDAPTVIAPVIEVASYLREEEKAVELILDTMAHEMIHYWLWVRRKPYGHNEEFYRKMREMGVNRYNTVPRLRPFRYLYLCAHCDQEYFAKRKWGRLACASCCREFAGGKFDRKFELALIRKLPRAEGLRLAQEKAQAKGLSSVSSQVES